MSMMAHGPPAEPVKGGPQHEQAASGPSGAAVAEPEDLTASTKR